ncbi:protein translocase subunit SecF [candidate division WWE3 bacterium CG09_land_8_20_14_0_10_39_24]|uniref:Protein-export membrane protein SecF n=2 Tax=Katanobacteria TaxID=422282 RepID=A0A2G9XBR4_UNCKA|nr:MAG: protein translocase subunit SecF [candidate division WWE3 bacterium CG23_combo_of_CG06-09_8_20_14_all_40_14]PIS12999.1 MAG: protein translocase subunit SecF [candidate division WWE3 bacterium CG09_land_8_20_14_0_10_39_24]
MSISMQTINFMKHKLLYLAISSLVIVPGIISLFVWGLKPAIDFTGGSLWEIRFNEQVSLSELGDNFQNSGDNQFLVRLKPTSEEEKNKMGEELERKFGKFEEIRFETVGPTLGKELLVKTLIAVLLAAGAILSYVGWRFKNKMYGLCAIIAMFHDTLVLIGTFSLLGHFFGVEVDTLFVTAVLTTLSFSVHDTVVVYDRIRESALHNKRGGMEFLANKAVTETMIRSLNNSLTILFMLTALVVLGGVTVKWFAAALLIGTIAGTYSSPFVAVPLLVVADKLKAR